MSTLSSNQIEITHIINPHLFWFKYIPDSDDGGRVATIESAIEKYVSENAFDVYAERSNGKYRLEPIVGVFLVSKKKWIRCEVDVNGGEPAADDELIVWATDYGIPIKTTLDKVVLLNVELKRTCFNTPSSIIQGGICDVLPASPKSNTQNEVRVLEDTKWDDNVIVNMEKMKSYTWVTLLFERKFETSDHVFGNLILYRENDENRKKFRDVLVDLKKAIAVSEQKFKRDIVGRDTIKIHRWLDNNGEIGCIENCNSPSNAAAAAANPADFYSSSASSSPKSSNSSLAASNSSPKNIKSPPKEEKVAPKEIDQRKLLQKFSRMQLTSTIQRDQASVNTSDSAPSLDSAQSLQKIQTKPRMTPHSTQSSSSGQSKMADQTKPLIQSKQSTPSIISTTSTPASDTQSLPLAQIEEARLFNKIQSVPVFLRNNFEEPIESIKSAPFTAAVHLGLKKMNLQETYLIQGYAWPNLLRGNSMVLVDSQNRGKTISYLPALCSMVQREFENAEAERGDKNKPRSKMGATAIIVCLTSNVKKIADDCRAMLQMPSFKSNVVEAIGTRDAVSVTVKLYNGCNILVATAPCLADLITNSEPIFRSDRLKCIAFENLDCIMEKQPTTVNFIVKNLCSRKSYKGDVRQFIVTSRTWQSKLLKFMNERDVTDSVLVIGNYLEAAFCAGVVLNFRLCKREVKLNVLTEHIETISYRMERTMIVCNSNTEAEQVAKHFDSKDIPNELIKEIESNYAQAKIKSFWSKIEGILICTDEHLLGLEIKNVQHILHFSVPTKEFRSFLSRHAVLLDFYDQGRNKEKATSTILLDDTNFGQLPKLVELLTRDGQKVPQQVLELSQEARRVTKEEKAKKQRFQSICNFVFMHGSSEHQGKCSNRHLLLPTDLLEDSPQISSGHLRFNVLKIISPTEYIVRPITHTANGGKWSIINQSNEFDAINTKMQAYYKDTDNQKVLHTMELGQKCVVLCHEIFYRAEIIEIHEKRKITDVDTYEVRFIDTGEVERRHAFEMFILDEQFQDLPNQALHLHLTSIIPADKEDDWDPCVCDQVRQYLNNLNANDPHSIYEANIVFALRNTIVVDVMRLTGMRHGIIHCSIKAYLQRRKYAISSSANRDKVVEMAKAAGVKVIAESPPKASATAQTFPDSKVGEEKNARNESSDALISFDESINDSISQDESNEKWECPWKAQHKAVVISQFNSPNDFYVVVQSEKRKKMYDAINEHMEKTSLDDSMGCPDVYKYCLVLVAEGYERAKVIEVIYGEDVQLKVFLVDTGFATTVDISRVFDIPDNIIQMLPFQAIWCNLVGIKPVESGEGEVSQWNEKIVDAIYDAIDEYGNDLILHTIATDRSVKSKIPDTNFVRHDIVLLAIREDEDQINMNQRLVAANLAAFDPSKQNALDNIPILVDEDNESEIDSESNGESDWDEECKAYAEEKQKKLTDSPPSGTESPESGVGDDFEQIFELLNDVDFMEEAGDFLKDLCKKERRDEPEPEIEPKPAMKESSTEISKPKIEWNNKMGNGYSSTGTNEFSDVSENSTDCQMENAIEVSENPYDRHQLEYVYKRPCVFWWQTEEMVVLKIRAHDNVEYGIEVTSDQLVYGTIENNTQIVAIIRFFGCVDYELVSHEVRGVNVVVRLRKSCPIMWPRLQHTAQKCTWVIQNIDAIKHEDFYDHAIKQFEKSKTQSDSDEESDEQIEPRNVHFDFEEDEDLFEE